MIKSLKQVKTLNQCLSGYRGQISSLQGDSVLVERLQELGLVPGEEISVLSKVIWGEPIIIVHRSNSIALRKKEAACLEVVAETKGS